MFDEDESEADRALYEQAKEFVIRTARPVPAMSSAA